MRDLDRLPKAHLHLHFTGSMNATTLKELAELGGVELPERLIDAEALQVPPNERGWYRFQRLYDLARNVVRSEPTMRHLVRQAARDDAREGSRRLELQVDPSTYGRWVNGITPALEIILDEARLASAETGVQVAIIVAASRVRHPLDARTLARLAVRYAGDGPGEVVGFGLSNDERNGDVADWEAAFRIARKGGLVGVPHGGELRGPEHIRATIDHLQPVRLGHGVRAAEDPALLERIAAAGIALEVCPASNVHLGIYSRTADVPLRPLLDAGARVALSADDPLLFLSRLTDQYRIARDDHGLDDEALAGLARASIQASLAPDSDKRNWLGDVDAWLATPGEAPIEPQDSSQVTSRSRPPAPASPSASRGRGR